MIGGSSSTNYYITVLISDDGDLEEKILVKSDLYGVVEVGDEVRCLVGYSGKEVVKIKVLE